MVVESGNQKYSTEAHPVGVAEPCRVTVAPTWAVAGTVALQLTEQLLPPVTVNDAEHEVSSWPVAVSKTSTWEV